jgi:hypothetical protein
VRNKKAPVRRRLPVKAPVVGDDVAADLDDLDEVAEVPAAAEATEAAAPAGRGGVVRRRPQAVEPATPPAGEGDAPSVT